MFPRPFHTFDHKGVPILFNVDKVKARQLDPSKVAMLDDISSSPKGAFSPAVERELKALDLLSPVDPKRPKRARSKRAFTPLNQITLLVTQRCNFRCVYCYGDGGEYGSAGEMTEGTAMRVVDWFVEQSGDETELTISFFGGEPLLNLPVIKKTVLYAKARAREAGKNVGFGITTNGSLLDEETIAYLRRESITPMVSFDGPEALQNAQRPFMNGKGSHGVLLSKFQQLLSVFPRTLCRATLLGGTDPLTVKKYLTGIGFSAISIVPAAAALLGGNSKQEGPPRNIPGMIRFIDSEAEEVLQGIKNRNTEQLRCMNKGSGMIELLDQLVNNRRKEYPCGAGATFAAVSCTGDIFLCQRFVGIEDHKLGDVFRGRLERSTYAERTVEISEECSQCFARPTCAGGCYYGNVVATGSIFEPDGEVCILMRRATEAAAGVSAFLDEDDKAYLAQEDLISRRPKLCPLDFPSSVDRS